MGQCQAACIHKTQAAHVFSGQGGHIVGRGGQRDIALHERQTSGGHHAAAVLSDGAIGSKQTDDAAVGGRQSVVQRHTAAIQPDIACNAGAGVQSHIGSVGAAAQGQRGQGGREVVIADDVAAETTTCWLNGHRTGTGKTAGQRRHVVRENHSTRNDRGDAGIGLQAGQGQSARPRQGQTTRTCDIRTDRRTAAEVEAQCAATAHTDRSAGTTAAHGH